MTSAAAPSIENSRFMILEVPWLWLEPNWSGPERQLNRLNGHLQLAGANACTVAKFPAASKGARSISLLDLCQEQAGSMA